MSLRLARHALLQDLRSTCFAPTGSMGGGALRLGLELELLVVDAATRAPFPLEASDSRATIPAIRRLASVRGWSAQHSEKAGVPEFHLPDGARLTFEPGGQVEYSSAPLRTVTALVNATRAVVADLSSALESVGAEVLTLGVDPETPLTAAPLQLRAERYTRMDRHFARIGSYGACMMRQTASLQVALDIGDMGELRWNVLNSLTPYLSAIFANASRYEGRASGWQSYRRQVWHGADPLRCGVRPQTADPAADYLDFALAAPALLLARDDRPSVPFSRWIEIGCVTERDWYEHLSTLFPEVRPRGYFELRTIDSLPVEWLAAPLAFLAGITYDADALHEAQAVLPPADEGLLLQAGRQGLKDPAIAGIANQLWDIALAGAHRVGESLIAARELDVARTYASRFTGAGLALADEGEPAAALAHA